MTQRTVRKAVVVEYQKRRKPSKHYVSFIKKSQYIISHVAVWLSSKVFLVL